MEERITGVMIYYYFVCKRKLWYFIHEISMEAENENVMLGKLLDENSYQRGDKHINIDNVINIDFIKEHKELHEVKKSRAIEEAGIWQVKYYLPESVKLIVFICQSTIRLAKSRKCTLIMLNKPVLM